MVSTDSPTVERVVSDRRVNPNFLTISGEFAPLAKLESEAGYRQNRIDVRCRRQYCKQLEILD